MPANHELIRLDVPHPRHRDVVRAFGQWAQVDDDVSCAAADTVFSGNATGLLMSGAQGSGKDTICPNVLEMSGITTEHCRVAHAIRGEMNTAIDIMRASATPHSATHDIIGELEVTAETAELYVNTLYEAAATDPTLDAERRTGDMRRVLQWHGSEGRADKPGYWVKIAYQRIMPLLAEGVSVHLTDGRFPGEIDAGRVVGLYCVRLWVPAAERQRRILARDGIEADVASLTHPGEIAADGYWGLDLEVANTDTFEAVSDVIADRYAAFRERLVETTTARAA